MDKYTKYLWNNNMYTTPWPLILDMDYHGSAKSTSSEYVGKNMKNWKKLLSNLVTELV